LADTVSHHDGVSSHHSESRIAAHLPRTLFSVIFFFFFNATPTTEIYTLSLHDALPIYVRQRDVATRAVDAAVRSGREPPRRLLRSEEHTSELQSRSDLVCRLLLEKKKRGTTQAHA